MSNPSFSNIDLWLFELNEGNLSKTQAEQLRMFLLNHPELDVDKDMWEKAFVTASEMEYEEQDRLKKRGFVWFPYAASIGGVIILGSTMWYAFKGVNPDAKLDRVLTSSVKENSKINEEIVRLPESMNQKMFVSKDIDRKDELSNPQLNEFEEVEEYREEGVVSSKDDVSVSKLDVKAIQLMNSNTFAEILEVKKVGSSKESKSKHKENLLASKLKRSINKMTNSTVALKNYREPYFDVPGLLATDINFGNVGSGYNFRVQTLSRLRWMGAENENFTNKVSVDGYAIGLKGGIGFSLEHDYYNQGGMNQGEFTISYSPKLWLNKKMSIEPSVRFKMGNKSIDNTKMNGVQQVELDRSFVENYSLNGITPVGRSFWYKDLGIGLLLNTKWFHLGAQVDNVFRHEENMFVGSEGSHRESLHFISTVGTDWVSAKGDIGFSPYVVYQNKGTLSELWGGFNFRWHWLTVGASISNDLAPMASLGVKLKRFSLRYSADYLRNGISKKSELSHQLTLRISTKTSRKGRALLNL